MSLGYDDQEMRGNMEAFEAAAHPRHVDLSLPHVRSILLALDGSNQDSAAKALAVAVARHTGASVYPLYAYEGADNPERDSYGREQIRELKEQAVEVVAAPRTGIQRSFEQILHAQREVATDLVILCAPYLDDFDALGSTSTGTNLDMVLAKSPVPILVARDPARDVKQCLSNILLPLTSSHACDVHAAQWSVLLARGHGDLRVFFVVDTEVLEGARHLVDAFVNVDQVDESALAGLDRPETAGLVAALQKAAWDQKFGCHITVRVGESVPVISELANAKDNLVITACPGRRPDQSGFQRVQALIRQSKNPVLIV